MDSTVDHFTPLALRVRGNEQATKQIAETEPCIWILVFQAQQTGDGKKTVRDGNLCGQPCQKLMSLVMSLFTAIVRKDVEGSVNV